MVSGLGDSEVIGTLSWHTILVNTSRFKTELHYTGTLCKLSHTRFRASLHCCRRCRRCCHCRRRHRRHCRRRRRRRRRGCCQILSTLDNEERFNVGQRWNVPRESFRCSLSTIFQLLAILVSEAEEQNKRQSRSYTPIIFFNILLWLLSLFGQSNSKLTPKPNAR